MQLFSTYIAVCDEQNDFKIALIYSNEMCLYMYYCDLEYILTYSSTVII